MSSDRFSLFAGGGWLGQEFFCRMRRRVRSRSCPTLAEGRCPWSRRAVSSGLRLPTSALASSEHLGRTVDFASSGRPGACAMSGTRLIRNTVTDVSTARHNDKQLTELDPPVAVEHRRWTHTRRPTSVPPARPCADRRGRGKPRTPARCGRRPRRSRRSRSRLVNQTHHANHHPIDPINLDESRSCSVAGHGARTGDDYR